MSKQRCEYKVLPIRLSKSFKGRADNASFWEAWCASRIAREGFNVTIMESFLGEYSKPEKATSYDLEVHIDSNLSLPLEVKSRRYLCADVAKPDIWVCSKNFFERCWPGWDVIGRDFLLVDSGESKGTIYWLPAGTSVEVGMQLDSGRGTQFQAVFAKTSELKPFKDFIKFLRGHL